MSGPADDGGEDSPGGVISGETGFTHAGAIVNYESGYIIVTHVGGFWLAFYSHKM
jgi:hypothetical protein